MSPAQVKSRIEDIESDHMYLLSDKANIQEPGILAECERIRAETESAYIEGSAKGREIQAARKQGNR